MQRRPAQDGKVAGASPATRTKFRGQGVLEQRSIGVLNRFRTAFPKTPLLHHSITPIFHGMSTGQANRACLLNSACLRASGASPRHSAIFPVVRSSRRKEALTFPSPTRQRPITPAFHFLEARVVQREPSAL